MNNLKTEEMSITLYIRKILLLDPVMMALAEFWLPELALVGGSY